jgi:hypothetical protein
MAVLHGTLTPADGPVLSVRLALTRPEAARRRRTGQTVAPPVDVTAIIDTGAEVTCVDPSVGRRLAATPLAPGLTNLPAAGGVGPSVRYDLQLIIGHSSGAIRPLDVPDLRVYEVSLTHLGYDAILGRDVLAYCVLIYDGVAGSFTLSY